MTGPQFEPMGVGQILDRAFLLYRRRFVRFIAIVAIIQVPVGLLSIAASQLFFRGTGAHRLESGGPVRTDVLLMMVGMIALGLAVLVSLFAQSLCNAALVKSVSETYLGGDVTVAGAYRFVLPKFGWLILAGLLVGLMVGAGLMMCVVPGIIFWVWYAVTTPAIVVENCNTVDGMSRSKALVAGNWGKVFLVSLVVFLIGLVLGWTFQYAGWLAGLLVFREKSPEALMLNQLGQLVGQTLAMPIGASASILLYYDLRIRKEGFDLEMLAKSLGWEAAPPNVAPPIQ